MTQATETLTSWEYKTCSRCGGSGHYSYCQRFGTKCFKCLGKGKVLTTRACAALAWLKQQRMTPLKEIKPGMRIKEDNPLTGKSWTATIEKIEPGSSCQIVNGERKYYIDIVTKTMSHGVFEDSVIEIIPATEEERVAQVRAAIAYQNQLTKSGTPRKRPATTPQEAQ